MWETEVQVSALVCTLSGTAHAGENAPAKCFSRAVSLKWCALTAGRNSCLLWRSQEASCCHCSALCLPGFAEKSMLFLRQASRKKSPVAVRGYDIFPFVGEVYLKL